MQTAWRAAHTQGGCSVPQADVSIWQTRCSGNRSREPNSGSSRGLRNRPLPCRRYQVTRAQLRSGGQQVSRRRCDGVRPSGGWVGGWVGSSRADGQVRVAGLPIVVCAAQGSARVGASSVSSPRWVSAKRKEGGAADAVAGEVQRTGGQWVVSRRCRRGGRRISRARVGAGRGDDVWYGVVEARAHTMGAAGAWAGPAACCSCRLCDTRYQS